MKLFVAVFFIAGLLQCGSGNTEESSPAPCGEEAIVKDLTGLDGCRMVLELNDGTILVPERRTYIQAPKKDEDPLYYFELTAGDRVTIDYDVMPESVNSCMAGKIVFITCISSKKNDE